MKSTTHPFSHLLLLVAGLLFTAAGLPPTLRAQSAAELTKDLPAVGTLASDFTVVTAGGKDVKLSDFRGKIVVLDFWATWCMPCQQAMPHLEKVWNEYKDQNVVVLAVSVGDKLADYESWVKSHSQYTFLTAHDPAGPGRNAIDAKLYGVKGIPQQFILGPDGHIAGEVGGYGGRDDARTEAVLAKLGVKVDPAVVAAGEAQLKEGPGGGQTVAAARSMPMIGFGGGMAKAGSLPFSSFCNLHAGDVAPDFTATGPDGQPVHLSDFKGKTIVLAFWDERPEEYLEKIYQNYRDQNVVVLGLAEAASAEEYAKWHAADRGATTYPTARDPAGKEFNSGISAVEYGDGMLPGVAVIGADGKLVGGTIGMGPKIPGIVHTLLARTGIKLTAGDRPAMMAAMRIQPHPAPSGPAESKVALLHAGQMAPDFVSLTLDGREVKPSDFRGKILVLDFWATWCGPCMASMPHTQHAAETYADQGVAVLASCTSDTRAAFEQWVKQNQSKYPNMIFASDPHARGSATFAQRASHALYGVEGIPTQFVIGRDGKIAAVLVGYDNGDHRLESVLASLGVKVDPALAAQGAAQIKQEAADEAKEAAQAKSEGPKLPLFQEFGRMKMGAVVPDFSAISPDGKTVKLSDYKGKTVIVDLWATWCGPCQMAMPHLQELWSHYQGKDVVVLGVCCFDTRPNYDKWLAENQGKYTFPTVFDPTGQARGKGEYEQTIMWRVFGNISPLPTTFVVNADGRFVGATVGFGPAGADALANLLLRAGVTLEKADMPAMIPALAMGPHPAPSGPPEAAVPLRKAGQVAPDFTAITAAGKEVKLSDYAGHVIVLDFWATWCGPCQAAMPHFQKAYETFKDQGVVFYGSCTADTKEAYDRWVARNQDKYTFLTAFDPAGRGPEQAAHKLYGVDGIPTQFVIGADGKIVDVIVGYDGPGDHRLEHALARAGVKVDLSKYVNDLPDPNAPPVPALVLKPAPGR